MRDSWSAIACVAGARRGKVEGKIRRARNTRSEEEGKRLPPADGLFRLAPSLNMQTANIHDSLPVKRQPRKILLTFSREPGARAKKCRVEGDKHYKAVWLIEKN